MFRENGKPRGMKEILRDIEQALITCNDEQVHYEWLTFGCNEDALWPLENFSHRWSTAVARGNCEGWIIAASTESRNATRVTLSIKHLGRSPFRIAEVVHKLLEGSA